MSHEGKCWLCGQFRPLTKEHIPPYSAFNDHEILLKKVDERSFGLGYLSWSGAIQKGLIIRSLCAECNNKAGSKYGSHYVEFVGTVAEKVERAADGERITVVVDRPLSILKQVIQNFVSANGQNFVITHPWIRKFLRSSRNKDFPSDVYVYAFAMKSNGGRSSGVGGFYDLVQEKIFVIAEFTFWPLGTVLAFQPMDQFRLAPIHQFCGYDYTISNAGLPLSLPVNPVASAHPVDFRTNDEIMMQRDPSEKRLVTEEQGQEMKEKVLKHAGKEEEESFIFSGHPSTFGKS